jgi:hypothetical protein
MMSRIIVVIAAARLNCMGKVSMIGEPLKGNLSSEAGFRKIRATFIYLLLRMHKSRGRLLQVLTT